MANGFTQGGRVVGYPSDGYPGINFRGAGASRGGTGGIGPAGGNAVSAVTGAIPMGIRSNGVIVIGLAVLGAWFLWHITSGR